jgi:hypothetical protein
MTTYISFEQNIKAYEDFKNSLPQDEFDKLYTELKIVRAIIASAKFENKDIDFISFEGIASKNLKKLHTMGYKKIH